MSHWIVAVALATKVLAAQPSVAVAPVGDSLPGIVLVGPGDPAFLPSVRALVGAANFPAYEAVLPYSVLVRNNTSRPVIDVCVIFDVTLPNGKKDGSSLAWSLGNIPPYAGAKPLLAPGAQLLAPAIPDYAYISPHASPPPAVPGPRLAQLNAAASVVISLDSVLFADGTLAGLYTQENFVRYSQNIAADRDFAAAVLAYRSGSVSGLQSYLDSEAAVTGNSVGSGSQRTYILRMAIDARGFQRILAKPAPKGGAAQVYTSATELASAATGLTLHK